MLELAGGMNREYPSGFDLVFCDLSLFFRHPPAGFEWLLRGDAPGAPLRCELKEVRDLVRAVCLTVGAIPRVQTLMAYEAASGGRRVGGAYQQQGEYEEGGHGQDFAMHVEEEGNEDVGDDARGPRHGSKRRRRVILEESQSE